MYIQKVVEHLMMTKRIYKFITYKNSRKEEDCIETSEHFVEDDEKFIIRDETRNRFVVYETFEDFKADTSGANSNSLHEVIRGTAKQKIKLDIDLSGEELRAAAAKYTRPQMKEQLLEAFYRTMDRLYDIDLLIDEEVVLCDSSADYKVSYHIILSTYYVLNVTEAATFAREYRRELINTQHGELAAGVDGAVYKGLQNFRLPNCYKPAEPQRVKRITTGHEYEDAIINLWSSVNELPLLTGEYKAAEKAPVGYEDIDDKYDREVFETAAPHITAFTFKSKKRNMYIFERKESAYCVSCEREHDNENMFLCVRPGGCVFYYCRRNMKPVKIGKVSPEAAPAAPPAEQFEREVVVKAPEYNIPAEFTTRHINTSDLKGEEEYNITPDHNTLLVKSGMGTAKTDRLIELLPVLSEQYPDLRIVCVSFRISFTVEMLKRYNETAAAEPFTSYLDVPTKEPLNHKRLIVQVESLHRYKFDERPTLVILDESEMISRQWMNSSDRFDIRWANYMRLVKNASYLIALDALMGDTTFEFIKRHRAAPATKLLINDNTDRCADSTDLLYEFDSEFKDAVITAARGAKEAPFVVAVTSNAQFRVLYDLIIEANPDAAIGCFNKQMTPELRAELGDVNANWTKYDVLMYSPSVLAGCSFTVPWFTRVFAYFSSLSAGPRSCIQMLGRVRSLEAKEYHIFISKIQLHKPETRADVLKALRCCRSVRNGDNYTLVMPKALQNGRRDDDNAKFVAARFIKKFDEGGGGDLDINPDDDLHSFLIGLIAGRYYAMNHFEDQFLQLRAELGYKCKKKGGKSLSKNEEKELWKKKKDSMEKYDEHAAALIADAADLPDDVAAQLTGNENLTADEMNQLRKYKLASWFNIPSNMITSKFVRSYSSTTVKESFRNLEQICGDKYAENNNIYNSTVRVLAHKCDNELIDEEPLIKQWRSNAKDVRLLLAIDIVNHVFADLTTDVKHFVCKEIKRAEMEPRINEIVKMLMEKFEMVSYLYSLIKKRYHDIENGDMKQKLGFINTILKTGLGLVITIDRTKATRGRRNTFIMKPISLFDVNDHGDIIVKIDEKNDK